MKKLFLITGTIFIASVIFAGVTLLMSAIPANSHRADTKVIKGNLVGLSTCCAGGDIIFNLENDGNKSYYINRGVQKGLVVDELKKALRGKEVTLLYHKRSWNVVNYKNAVKHVCEVSLADRVLYSELLD